MSEAASAAPRLRDLLPPGLRRAARAALRGAVDAVPPLARARDARRQRRRMRAALGYDPDFRNPRTFNERIARKILYDRDPLLVRTTDKIAARDFVAARIGAEYLVPLIGTWDRAADIPWDALPDRFVLKANHGSGMNLIVTDKARADRAAVLEQADRWLRGNHYEWTGEWAYSRIRPRLLAEEMLVGPRGVPEDFKYYVFGGRPRILEVHLDRFGRHLSLCYDTELNPLPYRCGESGWLLPAEADYAPPPEARGMAALAARLGAGFDFVRVDFYLVGGRAWFGELTHYVANACDRFDPPEWDRILGDMWAEGMAAAGTPRD